MWGKSGNFTVTYSRAKTKVNRIENSFSLGEQFLHDMRLLPLCDDFHHDAREKIIVLVQAQGPVLIRLIGWIQRAGAGYKLKLIV